MWYFGETEAQARTAIEKLQKEQLSQSIDAMLATQAVGNMGGNNPAANDE